MGKPLSDLFAARIPSEVVKLLRVGLEIVGRDIDLPARKLLVHPELPFPGPDHAGRDDVG